MLISNLNPGNEHVKRAIEIAKFGEHSIAIINPQYFETKTKTQYAYLQSLEIEP